MSNNHGETPPHRGILMENNAGIQPVPVPVEAIETEFRLSADEWRTETGGFSFDHQREKHPAYEQIVGLGEDAIPLILRELMNRPYHWFSALESLTGENPIKPEDEGHFQRMVEAWIDWGKKKGYIAQ